MKESRKRRAPHGATSLMVLDALVQLHTQGGGRMQVARAELLRAVPLPETTVDDRLRVLIKEGRVLRVGRALYEPQPWLGQAQRRSESPGTTKITILPNGRKVTEVWS